MTSRSEPTAHERRITHCRSCQARIVWFTTRFGKQMPIDAYSVAPEDQELDLRRHQSHFASCPNADQHRRKKP